MTWEEYRQKALEWEAKTAEPKFRADDYIVHTRYARALLNVADDAQVNISDGFLVLVEDGDTVASIPPWAWMERYERKLRGNSE
jgi:hypothetical protein